jgi:hypothetical protein
MEREVALAARLDRLERSNRRLRLGLALALLLATGGAILGAARGPGPVEATRFVLVDAKGRERGVLELAESGGPQLLLIDPEGNVQVALFAVPSGVRGLALHEGESLRAAFTAQPGGAATLAMEGPGRVSGGSLTLTRAGTKLGLWGAGGRVTATAPADPDLAARVETHDGDESLTGQVPPGNEPFGGPGRWRAAAVSQGGLSDGDTERPERVPAGDRGAGRTTADGPSRGGAGAEGGVGPGGRTVAAGAALLRGSGPEHRAARDDRRDPGEAPGAHRGAPAAGRAGGAPDDGRVRGRAD